MSSLSLSNPCIQTLISGNGMFFPFDPRSPAQTSPFCFGSSSNRAKSTSSVQLLFIDLHDRHCRISTRCLESGAAGSGSQEEGVSSHSSSSQGDNSSVGFWSKWKMMNSTEVRSKIAKLGLAAVLAYGLIDGVTYTTFFVLAFLGYEKSTGNNPAANLQSLLGIVILMWTGNNVTRPFRVAGAAALAPAIDKGLKKIQKHLNLPSQIYAFALVVGVVVGTCLAIVGLLILSRWGK